MVIFQALRIVFANDVCRQSTRWNVFKTYQNFDLPSDLLDYTRIYHRHHCTYSRFNCGYSAHTPVSSVLLPTHFHDLQLCFESQVSVEMYETYGASNVA
jgi:hypothetical protein